MIHSHRSNNNIQHGRLFVYGTLITGVPDVRLARSLRKHARIVGIAYINAKLYDIGRYPGAMLSDNPRHKVWGRVLHIQSTPLLKLLDRYEDFDPDHPDHSEFIRCDVSVRYIHNKKHSEYAMCYVYNRPINRYMRINNGIYSHKLFKGVNR